MATTLDFPTSAFDVLGTVPCFDLTLGVELMSLAGHKDDAEHLLSRITNNGIALSSGGLYAIPNHKATELRGRLLESDISMLRRAISLFIEHARNRLKPPLALSFGEDGLNLLTESLAVVLSPDQASESFDDLIRDREQQSKFADLSASARVLDAYGQGQGRTARYLHGMTLWHLGKRAEAFNHFSQVWSSGVEDRMAAVAGHLQAVHLHSDLNRTSDALELLDRTVDVQEHLDDAYGLVVTLSTRARTLLDRFRSLRNEGDLWSAFTDAERAVNTSVRTADGVPVGSLHFAATLTLANLLLEVGKPDDGNERAGQARLMVAKGSIDSLRAAMTSARALRNLERFGEAADVLVDELNHFVPKSRSDTRHKAIALNVLASIQRFFDLHEALQNAEESLDTGRRIKDTRHTAHATLTASQIRLDILEERTTLGDVEADLRNVKSSLYVAKSKLTELRDADGLRRTNELLERVTALQFSLEDRLSGSQEPLSSTLHEERPVVEKETVPVERVRLDKETVADEMTVDEEVRKERIDTDGIDDTRR
jgi:stress response protein YsnF